MDKPQVYRNDLSEHDIFTDTSKKIKELVDTGYTFQTGRVNNSSVKLKFHNPENFNAWKEVQLHTSINIGLRVKIAADALIANGCLKAEDREGFFQKIVGPENVKNSLTR